MKNRSLALRLVFYLVVAQLAAFTIAWVVTIALGLSGVELFATSWDELATTRAANHVIESLVAGEGGVVRIEPTPELRAELERAPSMKYAVFDSSKRPLAGSSPELAAMLPGLIGVSPSHTHFVLPGDRDLVPQGLMEPRSTRFGRLHVAVHGQKFRWDDLFYAWREEFKWLAVYLAAATLLSTATAWFAVRWGLFPLRAVADEAAHIDMNSLDQRLSSSGVPTEINPLVDAMNEALSRLDAGAALQRRFTANAAHELRTPIAILSTRLDAPEEATFKADLKRDARRILNIVEQLLAAARIESRAADLIDEVDLVAIARAAVADGALLTIRNGRQIALDAPGAPVLVRGSRDAIESVVANLIDNAARAEPINGTVLVRVSTDAMVEVIDHGEGVAESDRQLIFEPFWRKTDTRPGTGLGLAIAKEIMDAHGGRISVEETPGGGATFKLFFQRKNPNCLAAAHT